MCCATNIFQERVLQKLNSHHNQQALKTSIEEGLKLQAQNRLQRMLRQVGMPCS